MQMSLPLVVWSRPQPRRAGSGGADLLAFKRIPNLMCTEGASLTVMGTVHAARDDSVVTARLGLQRLIQKQTSQAKPSHERMNNDWRAA